MSLEQLASSRRKAFVFIECEGYLGCSRENNFIAHSCGNGRFIRGPPSPDLSISFRLEMYQRILKIYILEDDLLQWLRAIPSLRNELHNGMTIWMKHLLPCYPEMSAKFDEDRREGRSFDTLELFVRHFLHEGSVFAAFGFGNLHEIGILTDLHLHHILSQTRSMSKDLELLDEAVDEIDEQDIKGPNNSLHFVDEPFQSQLLTAIRRSEAQECRTMAHRLLAEVTNSCQKLADASTMQSASAGVIAFMNLVGTSASVWKKGTGVIRDIRKGYRPRNLSDIVSVLQVANAMRSVVPPSRLGYSKREFIDDIPRWASLLSPDDQHLFFEVASYLWGIPASTVADEMADSLTRFLSSLHVIVIYLVKISGSENSYRLQTLRRNYALEMTLAYTISPSSMTTATPGLIIMGTSMDGAICCEHCNSKFKLGKNGRRGQASNLQKHMKIHHPETIPDYHRVIYNCRYGCGTSDPNKSNIRAHENKHCARMKGKQPRRHGKWRQAIT